MKRDPTLLTKDDYDLLVIGGGIYGACVAWDATLRGLSVALIEKRDFASATSANSLKIIHGGFRYLQNLDIRRLRDSANERRHLMHIAPHLVHPMCTLVPMRGHKLTHQEPAMRLALRVNDILTFDRNHIADQSKHIAAGRWVAKRDLSELLPDAAVDGSEGAVLFYDAQVYDSERLVIAFIKSAVEAGAVVANYVEASKLLARGGRVAGVEAIARPSGEKLTVRAQAVVNTAGPWVNEVACLGGGKGPGLSIEFAKALNAIVRPLFNGYAVGLLGRGGRFLFVAPWRGKSIVGTAYAPYHGSPDEFRPVPRDAEGLLDDFNQAYPSLCLTMEDVSFVHAGLLPYEGVDLATGEVRLAQHPIIHDHCANGLSGLLSVAGVKYTTARRVAEETVNRVFRDLGYRPPPSRSASIRLQGGAIEQFDKFLADESSRIQSLLDAEQARRLLLSYGTDYRRVMSYLPTSSEPKVPKYSRLDLARAETLHAVQEEMAQTLADVVFRRTGLGSAGHPGTDLLTACAQVMSEELGWDSARVQQELQSVEERYPVATGVTV